MPVKESNPGFIEVIIPFTALNELIKALNDPVTSLNQLFAKLGI